MKLTKEMEFSKLKIKTLTDMMKSGELVVDDSFQRKFIWRENEMVGLIETILMGYPIPEIYLWEQGTDPDTGDSTQYIIDGQQRLKSVTKFINDDFCLSKKYLDHKDADYSGKFFSELGNERTAFWAYPFFARIIQEDVKRDSIVKMFLRLNKTNTTLNPQELRHAKYNGLFVKLAVSLTEDDFWKEHTFFKHDDIRRMKDVQFISTLLIFLRYGIAEATTQTAINKAYDQYNTSYKEHEEDRNIFLKILELIEKYFFVNDKAVNFLKSQTHFYTLFIYCYEVITNAKELDEDQTARMNEFIDIYMGLNLDTPPQDNIKEQTVYEYRLAASEGVQKKANRMARYKCMKRFLEDNF